MVLDCTLTPWYARQQIASSVLGSVSRHWTKTREQDLSLALLTHLWPWLPLIAGLTVTLHTPPSSLEESEAEEQQLGGPHSAESMSQRRTHKGHAHSLSPECCRGPFPRGIPLGLP